MLLLFMFFAWSKEKKSELLFETVSMFQCKLHDKLKTKLPKTILLGENVLGPDLSFIVVYAYVTEDYYLNTKISPVLQFPSAHSDLEMETCCPNLWNVFSVHDIFRSVFRSTQNLLNWRRKHIVKIVLVYLG